MRFCLNILENFSNSSKSVLSSGGNSNLWGSCVDGCSAVAEVVGIRDARLVGCPLGWKIADPGNRAEESVAGTDVVLSSSNKPGDHSVFGEKRNKN